MKNWKKHEGSMPTLTKEDKNSFRKLKDFEV